MFLSHVGECRFAKEKVKAIPCVLPGIPLKDSGNPRQFRPIQCTSIQCLVTSLKILISERKYHLIQIQIEQVSAVHTFFVRNSVIRNLYWDGQITKKLSVLKSQRLRNLYVYIFLSFSCHNFEDTVTNFNKDMLLSVVQTLIVK